MKRYVLATMFTLALGTLPVPATAAIISIGQGAFVSPTIETFNPASTSCSFTVSNTSASTGLAHTNLEGEGDCWNYTGGYGLLYASVSDGIDGLGDGYFGTGITPTSFEFTLPVAATRFGFYAEEACCVANDARDGQITVDFFDAANALLGSATVVSGSAPVWDAFFGFESTGNPIQRVVFRDIGHAVFDNVQFEATAPEPAAILLFGTAAIYSIRRRAKRSA